MTLLEAINVRHTVRNYDGKAIEGDTLAALENMISGINEESGLHIQLVNGVENAFDCFTIRYGKWTGVTNYIALIGKKSDLLQELCGYYGEQIVLWAQTQGLKTGWVETGCTDVPAELSIGEEEELVLSIAIGFSGKTGNAHKIKTVEETSTVEGEAPEWFNRGMEAAVLAPTAGNQQLFHITWDGRSLHMTTQPGFLEQVDLGVVKYHFELASGISHESWK